MKLVLEVDVTRKHIAEGTRNNPYACPVALALTEAATKFFNPDAHVTVDTSFINFFFNSYDNARMSIPTPDKIINFISDFDEDEPVAPFTFRLEENA